MQGAPTASSRWRPGPVQDAAKTSLERTLHANQLIHFIRPYTRGDVVDIGTPFRIPVKFERNASA